MPWVPKWLRVKCQVGRGWASREVKTAVPPATPSHPSPDSWHHSHI